jgi:hypothetical protein
MDANGGAVFFGPGRLRRNAADWPMNNNERMYFMKKYIVAV